MSDSRLTRKGRHVPKTSHTIKDLTLYPATTAQQPFPKPVKCYLQDGPFLVVPRFYGAAILPLDESGLPSGDSMAPGVSFVGSLRDDLHQRDAVDAVCASFDRCGGALLCLPVGFGKTTVSLHIAARLGKKCLVLCHKTFLLEQWTERIRQFVPGATISTIRGAECDLSGDFVLATIQTLLSRGYHLERPDDFARVHLMIVDECHHVGAAVFSSVMWGLCCPLTLGLSATPDRKDGLSKIPEYFLGPIAFRVQRENQATTVVRVHKHRAQLTAKTNPKTGAVCFATYINDLVDLGDRTAAIAEVANAEKGARAILILSHRKQHCQDLAARIPGSAVYLAGKPKPAGNPLIATYSLVSEGFDDPSLNCLIFATPASDVVQACGRVMRGSSDCLIIDFVDTWGPGYAQFSKRRAFYTKSGFRMTYAG